MLCRYIQNRLYYTSKNINKKADNIHGYGICPNLANVWCKPDKNGP